MGFLHQKQRLLLLGAAALIAALFAFTVFYFSYYFSPYANQDQTELFENWTYCTASDPAPHLLQPLDKVTGIAPGETMIMTRTLQEETASQVLMVKNYYQTLRVYLNETKLLETPAPAAGKNPGAGLSFIPLTAADQGKTLRLEITSPFSSYSGILMPVYLGEADALQAKIIAEAMPHIFFLFVCTVIGFFFLLSSVICNNKAKRQWDSFFFGLFSVLLGFFCISRDDLMYLLFPPVLVTEIAIGLHTVYLIPLMAYLYCYFSKYKKLVRIILTLLCACAALFYLLHWTGLSEFPTLIPLINWVLMLSFVPIVVLVLYELFQGNQIIRFLFPIMILVIIFCTSSILLYHKNPQGLRPLYLTAFFLLVIAIWAYHLREFVRQRIHEKKQVQALQFRNELAQKSNEAMAAHMEETRMLRHEIGHHIAALKILNEQGDSGRIADYLSAISVELNSATVLYTENNLINSIVAERINLAMQSDIKVTADICVPRSLPMDDPDLCSLLTNLLDNAIEACKRLPENRERFINLQLRMKGSFLVISCANASLPLSTDREGNFLTSKAGTHGYGIPIMRNIAQKYGSPLRISHENGTFHVRMALQL